MTKTETFPLDLSDYLDTAERRAALMADAFTSGDREYIAIALGHIAKAYGIAKLAEETGMTRQAIYQSFSAKGNPTLETITKILPPLGITLDARVT